MKLGMGVITTKASDVVYDIEKRLVKGEKWDDIKATSDITKKLPKNCELLEALYDKDSGTCSMAMRDPFGKIVIAYAGTNMDADGIKDILTDGAIPWGLNSHCKKPLEFAKKIQEKYKTGKDLVITGHSLGGNIAQDIALQIGAGLCFTYNAAPLAAILHGALTTTVAVPLLGILAPLTGVGMAMANSIRYGIMQAGHTGKIINMRTSGDELYNLVGCVGHYAGEQVEIGNGNHNKIIQGNEDLLSKIEKTIEDRTGMKFRERPEKEEMQTLSPSGVNYGEVSGFGGMSKEILVDTAVMRNSAQNVLTAINAVETTLTEIRELFKNTECYWAGDAGKHYRSFIMAEQEDISFLMHRLKEHPEDLFAMAGGYEEVEKQITGENVALQSNYL